MFSGERAKSRFEIGYETIRYAKDNDDTVKLTLAIKKGSAYLVEEKLSSDISF